MNPRTRAAMASNVAMVPDGSAIVRLGRLEDVP